MPLTPVFKIGLWNAWILMLIALLPQLILMIVDSTRGKGELFIKKMGGTPTDQRERMNNNITSALYYVLVACAIFLPLRLGTLWFYLGCFIWLTGLLISISALVTVATTPLGQIFARGIFRFSRHPLYLSMILIFMGIGIATASWVFVLGSFVFSVLQNSNAMMEERTCMEIFGEQYRTYLKQTPRWLGIPKSE